VVNANLIPGLKQYRFFFFLGNPAGGRRRTPPPPGTGGLPVGVGTVKNFSKSGRPDFGFSSSLWGGVGEPGRPRCTTPKQKTWGPRTCRLVLAPRWAGFPFHPDCFSGERTQLRPRGGGPQGLLAGGGLAGQGRPQTRWSNWDLYLESRLGFIFSRGGGAGGRQKKRAYPTRIGGGFGRVGSYLQGAGCCSAGAIFPRGGNQFRGGHKGGPWGLVFRGARFTGGGDPRKLFPGGGPGVWQGKPLAAVGP